MRHIRVLVYADAPKEALIAEGERLVIYVREPAQRNMANRRVVAMVAEHLGVTPHLVRIVTGHRSPQKTLEAPD